MFVHAPWWLRVGVQLSVLATVFALARSRSSQSQIFPVMIYLCCSQMSHVRFSCSLGRTAGATGRYVLRGRRGGCKSMKHTHLIALRLCRHVYRVRAPGPTPPLCDLCLQLARIPAGRVLHTDHQEEGDVQHADVRSPPHIEHEGHVELHTEF